jgi:hypothetical protein
MILRVISDITSDIVDAAVNLCREVIHNFVINRSCAEWSETLAQDNHKLIAHSVTEAVYDICAELAELLNIILDYISFRF